MKKKILINLGVVAGLLLITNGIIYTEELIEVINAYLQSDSLLINLLPEIIQVI